MYFVLRRGSGDRGVFHIGPSVIEAVQICDKLRLSDYDDYHDWCVFEYVDQIDQIISNPGFNYKVPDHTLVYCATKTEITINNIGATK